MKTHFNILTKKNSEIFPLINEIIKIDQLNYVNLNYIDQITNLSIY